MLEAGINRAKKVYNGLGKPVDKPIITSIYNEIFEVRNPWRSEWLDIAFSEKNGDLYLTQDHILKGNTLEGRIEKLESPYIHKDGWIDITSFNRQGLPTKKLSVQTSVQKTYYYRPVDGGVAGFNAGSGRAGLGCDGDPQLSGASLGVRAARKKI